MTLVHNDMCKCEVIYCATVVPVNFYKNIMLFRKLDHALFYFNFLLSHSLVGRKFHDYHCVMVFELKSPP